MVRDDCGGDLVHPKSAILLGNIDRSEPKIRGLAQESGQHAGLLGIDIIGGWQNFVAGKLGHRRRHLSLFFVQVLRGEDFRGRAGLDKKASALGGNDGRNCCRRHLGSLQLYGNITLIWKTRQSAGGKHCRAGETDQFTRWHRDVRGV